MLAVTRWVCRAGSPAREERWRKAIARKPRPGLDRLAALAALHEAGVSLQVADRLGYGVIVGAKDRLADLGRADRVEQRDRLRRGEADVVAEDRLEAALAPLGVDELARLGAGDEDVARAGIFAGENGGVGVAVDLALEAQLGRQLAHPLTRRLAGLRVVVLAAFGHGLDPVVGVGGADLRHSHHRPCCPPRGPIASGEPEGVSYVSQRCQGSSPSKIKKEREKDGAHRHC